MGHRHRRFVDSGSATDDFYDSSDAIAESSLCRMGTLSS
jgi:hypothetical protein